MVRPSGQWRPRIPVGHGLGMQLFVLPFPQIDPVIFEIGPIGIRWYGLAYFAGILLGWVYARRLCRDDRLWPTKSPITVPILDDFLIWATIGIVVGGRLGFVLFYQPQIFAANPMAIFQIWEGGMAFHGGLLGVILAMIFFARARRIPPFSLSDVISASVPIGLFFGRVANFINGELWGRPTDLPWAMVFPNAGPEPRHPSQLYEALLEGVLIFLVLRILIVRFGALARPGLVSGTFLALYGASRFFVEFFRSPDPWIGVVAGFLTRGMILSLPMIAIGLIFMAMALRKPAGTPGQSQP